ncbi:MAG: 4-hydroxythreonine-4-phosphate dehydrogenase PdxA [Burkholderiaceae bacterium]|nr:4-hydroxythreonine-4-phosphate dehydrogenase PdxA [Burkholderiaceae bacterium]
MKPAIAITIGEPAGIGPELSLAAAWALRDEIRPLLIGDFQLLSRLAPQIDPDIRLRFIPQPHLLFGGVPDAADGLLPVVDCPLAVPAVAGQLDARNGRAVLDTLDVAIEGATGGWFDAIVTAPLQKSTINDAGVAFTGHTEYLAEKTHTPQVVMMLMDAAGPSPLRVALATTHLPLKDVSAAITFDSLSNTLDIVQRDLRSRFGIEQPRILVTGLNPHAGEGGYLGHEEIDVIAPAIEAAQRRGIDARGPFPADTLFQPRLLQQADCVLAMYHDQGLPVLKYVSFGHGVNVTLGLPIIRTSVDHGTALDIAAQGVGHAERGSMLAAVRLAASMATLSQRVS